MKPGTIVRYSDAYLVENHRADPDARFVVAEPCPPKRSRKGKPACWLCVRGCVRLMDGLHIHADNLTEINPSAPDGAEESGR